MSKGPPPAGQLPDAPLHPLLRVFFEAAQLKQLFRQGWLRAGVPAGRCESVAEHTFGVALLGLLAAGALFPELDAGRLMRLALLHDLGEARTGDLYAPADGVPTADKHRREEQALVEMLSGLPGAEEWLSDWREYERGESAEARLVRQLDRLEMALQAVIYERQEGLDLQEFLDSAASAVHEPEVQALLEEIRGLRPAR